MQAGAGAIEYNDTVVRQFAVMTVVWGIVGMLVGVIIAAELIWPDLNMGLPYLSYGRLRPLHTNAVIFAFGGCALFATSYYVVQHTCHARLISPALAGFTFWGWQTVIVLAAVATMIALGIWQLGRSDEKEALITRYSSVSEDAATVAWPQTEKEVTARLFQPSEVECTRVTARRTTAATSAAGAKGLSQIATCELAEGGEAEVVLGFTRQPVEGTWAGGTVSGLIAPGPRLVASPPVAGLEPVARPDPNDLPNNHLAYAGQWFFFALTALVIYILALKRRQGAG